MAEGRAASEWAQTSALLAMLANCHRDPKKTRAFAPGDFNPFEVRQRRRVVGRTRDLSLLRTVFVDRHQPETRKENST